MTDAMTATSTSPDAGGTAEKAHDARGTEEKPRDANAGEKHRASLADDGAPVAETGDALGDDDVVYPNALATAFVSLGVALGLFLVRTLPPTDPEGLS